MMCYNSLQNTRISHLYFWIRYLNTKKSNLSHYDILRVKNNCTEEEIRNAFIKLSKKYHPDTRKTINDSHTSAHFVQVREAYQVLKKKSSRAAYDQDLFAQSQYTYDNLYSSDKYKSATFHANANEKPGPYYGVNGLKKVSNLTIVWILLVFATLGTTLEYFLVKYSFTFNRKRFEELSKKACNVHETVREDAVKYGNEKQLERVLERFQKPY